MVAPMLNALDAYDDLFLISPIQIVGFKQKGKDVEILTTSVDRFYVKDVDIETFQEAYTKAMRRWGYDI